MTHKQLVALISQRSQCLAQANIEQMFTHLANIIAEELAQGEIVTVRDIGTFTSLAIPERMGNHPKTGEKILLPTSRRVKLKPCVALKSKVK